MAVILGKIFSAIMAGIIIGCLFVYLILICVDCWPDEWKDDWKDDKKNDTIEFEEFKMIVHTVNSLNNAILARYGSNHNPIELSISTDWGVFGNKIITCKIIEPSHLHIRRDVQDGFGPIYNIKRKHQRQCYKYYKKHINSYKVQNTKLYDELSVLRDKTINYIDKK